MMQKIQRFGGAMYTPVLLFAFAGICVGVGTLFTTEAIMGSLASADSMWYQCWNVVLQGGWTVFNQLPLLFVVGLPVALAKKQNARCCMEAIVIYLTFNYFLSTILEQWGTTFGVDFAAETGNASGLAMIAGIKTLDMGMMGALLVSGIAIAIHNRYYDKELPDWLGTFSGSAFVVMVGFVVMLPTVLACAVVWPKVQYGMSLFQGFIVGSGAGGVWVFTLLERILIPTGLHHFIYTPFFYDSAVVSGGLFSHWANMLPELAASTESLKSLVPEAGFTLTGMSKVFGCTGIAMAIYATAKQENKKKVAGLLLPITLTAILCGVTEPIEFTFLFIAPPLFAVHAVLAATMATVCYLFGVVGIFSGGVIEMASYNWIPLMNNHYGTYITQLVIGLIFTGLYFVIFRALILRFDFKTPGRDSASNDVRFASKKDYKAAKGKDGAVIEEKTDPGAERVVFARKILEGLGGKANIVDVTNCATRLRVSVKDGKLVQNTGYFTSIGAHGLSVSGNAIQVIVGLSVPKVRDEFEQLLESEDSGSEQQRERYTVDAPLEGQAIPHEQIKDDAFASGAMGSGVGIIPSDQVIFAPDDGRVEALFPTNHAIGLTLDNGAEILIHIGVDTVQTEGKGFTAYVAQGDVVTKGQKLLSFDKEQLEREGYDVTTAVLVMNKDKYDKVAALDGVVRAGEPVIELVKK